MPARITKRARHDEDRQDTGSSDAEDDFPSDKIIRQTVADDSPTSILTCSLPPGCNTRPQSFPHLAAFEAHYATQHSHRCLSCLANFPSDRWLDLHLEEVHDPIWAERHDRGESVFRCFESNCRELFKSSSSRRRHLQHNHQYPAEFRFNVVTKGLPSHAISLLHDFPPPSSRAAKAKKKQPDIATPVATKGTEGVLTRAQRRAQARRDQEAADAGHADSEAVEGTSDASQHIKAQKKREKDKPDDPKQAHAKAVQALFRGIEDPDELEPAMMTGQEDAEMDELATTMHRSNLVPAQIKFGR